VGLRPWSTLAVVALLLGAATAQAVPPLPVESLPCVSPALATRTVLVRTAGGLRHVTVSSAVEAAQLAQRLQSRPGVRWAEVDRPVHALRTPNDPLAPRQWALQTVRATAAWDVETGRRNPVVVAVLDTGVDATHPELLGHVRAGGDFVDGDTDPRDEEGHGTAVSGVIAATSNNRQGVAGISWGATVLAERVLGKDGSGSQCTVSAGIYDAVDAGARVLNLSLGGPGNGCPMVLRDALAYAHDHGALVVVSAGNDAAKGNPVDYPAGCEGAFAVAATDSRDRATGFSEYGPQVDISAPGLNVLTTVTSPDGVHGYAYVSGTSLSAPIVTGAAALLLSLHPTWTPDQVRARLVATARDLGPRGRDDHYGAGRVDIGRALR
jgi:subtilisin family serine protease